jgi:hypothetical protein
MPRTLKTYVTNLGFFELALAAPSMKAALEAWGMGHDAFRQGFAKETHDAKTVASTMAKPGIVLRRPVGTKGEFKENAELPEQLWKLKPQKTALSKPKPKAAKKSRAKVDGVKERESNQAAILSFEKAKARRDREREKAKAREDVQREKERVKVERAIAKADDAIDRALVRHEEKIAVIAQERERLDRLAAAEEMRWKAERSRLEETRERATE